MLDITEALKGYSLKDIRVLFSDEKGTLAEATEENPGPFFADFNKRNESRKWYKPWIYFINPTLYRQTVKNPYCILLEYENKKEKENLLVVLEILKKVSDGSSILRLMQWLIAKADTKPFGHGHDDLYSHFRGAFILAPKNFKVIKDNADFICEANKLLCFNKEDEDSFEVLPVKINRSFADMVYREGLGRFCAVGHVRRWMAWAGVRLFGFLYFDEEEKFFTCSICGAKLYELANRWKSAVIKQDVTVVCKQHEIK